MIEDSVLRGNLFCLANVNAKKVLDSLEDEDEIQEIGRKRKRLDDFTPQEKMVRRKLKNRVAAQNARDRKKERLEQLEIVVTRLEKENKELKKSNEDLRTNMSLLMSQNKTMRQKLGMDELDQQQSIVKTSQTPIITPTVLDHDHIVIKKEEVTEPEYASLGISPQKKVQTGQLLDLLEQLGAGSSGEVTLAEKVDVPQKQEQQPQSEINRDSVTYESHSDNSELSGEDRDELFSLCQEIQDLVDGSDNDLDEMDLNVVSLIEEIPEEVTKLSSKKARYSDKILNTNIFHFKDSDMLQTVPENSNLEDSGFSSESSWDEDFLDLFPNLASV